jgi:hypothetical protein
MAMRRSDPDPADEVICDFLRGSRGSEAALRDADADVVLRMFDLWSGTAAEPLPDGQPIFRSVADVDQWNAALGTLARAHPEQFLDQVERMPEPGPDDWSGPTILASILGSIDDERAVALLGMLAGHQHDLVRDNAARALLRHAHRPTALARLRQCLSDPSASVRLYAIKGLSASDPARALAELEEMLRPPARWRLGRRRPPLTPLQEQAAGAFLAELRETGRIVQEW